MVSADAQSSQFSVYRRGELLGRVELNIPGKHNVLNALSVIAIADELGVSFQGVNRRTWHVPWSLDAGLIGNTRGRIT